MFGRIQDAYRHGPPQTANRRERSKEENLVAGDGLDGAIHLFLRRRDAQGMKFVELIGGHELVQVRAWCGHLYLSCWKGLADDDDDEAQRQNHEGPLSSANAQ